MGRGRKPMGEKTMEKSIAFRVPAGDLRPVDELAHKLKTNRSSVLRRLVKKVGLLLSSESESIG